LVIDIQITDSLLGKSDTGMWKNFSNNKILDHCDSFADSIEVWLKRPNVCCKMISCCCLELINLDITDTNADSLLFYTDQTPLPLQTLKFAKSVFNISKQIVCLSCHGIQCLQSNCQERVIPKSFLRKLVPRRPDVHSFCYEFVVDSKYSLIFIPLNTDTFLPSSKNCSYLIQFTNSCSSKFAENHCVNYGFGVLSSYTLSHSKVLFQKLGIEYLKDTASSSNALSNCFVTKTWLLEKLLPTLCNWCEEKNEHKKSSMSKLPSSLSLIDQEKYAFLYHKLKKKYGTPLSLVFMLKI